MANNSVRKEDDVREPGPVRGQAGEYLETELLGEVLGPLPGLFLGAGVVLGAGLHRWSGWMPILGVGIASLAGTAYFWFWRKRQRKALRKGHIAERQIGRALEQAITAKGCAVAHNVTGVMDSGDIDHIVATRQRAWVIETKYRRVPKGKFGNWRHGRPGVRHDGVAGLRRCPRAPLQTLAAWRSTHRKARLATSTVAHGRGRCHRDLGTAVERLRSLPEKSGIGRNRVAARGSAPTGSAPRRCPAKGGICGVSGAERRLADRCRETRRGCRRRRQGKTRRRTVPHFGAGSACPGGQQAVHQN